MNKIYALKNFQAIATAEGVKLGPLNQVITPYLTISTTSTKAFEVPLATQVLEKILYINTTMTDEHRL